MKRAFAILLTVLLLGQSLMAETPVQYSLGMAKNTPLYTLPSFEDNTVERYGFWQRRTVQMGLGLVGSGMVLSVADVQTRSLRNDLLPTFHNTYDDYMQFAPGVALLAMKLCGLESRNDLPQIVVSGGLSMAIYISAVYGTKYLTGRLRPDGSAHNSFPSGHTANAFFMATLLHKEYGHLSRWVSIAGYTTAVATGVGRSLNNKHWFSDVIVGAGVGIFSTELGYWLARKLFADSWRVLPTDDFAPVEVGDTPSYVGISVGGGLLPYDKSKYRELSPSGVAFDLEGAWYLSPSWGVGGKARVGRFSSLVEQDVVGGEVVDPKPINNISLQGGLFYTHTFENRRWQVGAKALAGISYGHYQTFGYLPAGTTELGTIESSTDSYFSATAGLWGRYIMGNNLGIRGFVDYNYLQGSYTLTHPSTQSSTHIVPLRPLTVGVAIDVMLW